MKNPCSYIFVFGFLSFLLYFVFPIYQAPVNHKRNYVKGKVSYYVRNLVASIKIQLKKKKKFTSLVFVQMSLPCSLWKSLFHNSRLTPAQQGQWLLSG